METFRKFYFAISVIIIIHNSIFSQTGMLSGKVIDSDTHENLPGVNLIINELENRGAASDENGNFSMELPVGSYSVKASLIGYLPVVKTDLVIKSKSQFFLEIYLTATTLELEGIIVQADYFDKSTVNNNLSTVVLGVEEVRRSPGSMGDFQRILQAMPGVSFSNDQNNELLVRGGSPNENLTILDGMEIHSTNHYPNEFNSGGPINMINTELIQNVQFSTGGFISKFGDKLSSVMEIATREGTRNSGISGSANFGMAGIGAIAEGNINGGKGSWIFSVRKSYIDLIAGGFGLTAIPKYYDGQFKISYDLSQSHKISWSGIYGNDKIILEGVSDLELSEKKGATDSVDVSNIDVKQNQWASGISLKSFWSKNLFSDITFYANNYHNDILYNLDYTQRIFDVNGKLTDTKILDSRKFFQINSDNMESAIRANFSYVISPTHKIEFGGSLKFGSYRQNIFIDADTVRYDINQDGIFFPEDQSEPIIIVDATSIDMKLKLFDNNKSYFYLNDNLKLFDERLILNAGIRYDYFTYSKQGNLSPRFSASYYFIPRITSFNFSYGEFYQTQSYPTYGDRKEENINQFLKNTHSRHFVAGIEHILNDGLKINFEGYHKKYNDIPIEETFIHFNDRTFRSEKFLNIGEQTVYGLDFLIQQKLVKDIYGTFSFSRMWTEVNDPRIGYEGKVFKSDYDFPYVFTIIFGKQFLNARKTINELPFIIKYPSYLLPISDDMELSLRWRYASGKTYTKQIYTTSEQHRSGGITWTQGAWIPSSEINGERYEPYHRLDFAINSRFNFETWNIVFILSVQNVYNRKNIAGFQYNSDGTIENIYQFSLLPVAEIQVEF